ncbi:PREDICTED: eukaryotic translation initiation factor 5-like [Branchiostoma belcheri]|uniref:Eukaryotic translation initiation factor 5 n=1 Tax=Branchiostoma belcheri TaxID=7741 RepID=A0A6P4Y9F7_BRABE|nr:PREDICTED: eukaryotic translation initiation factor 5-like [Branchiostoma belcheri]XP_019625675.1 PREDICTED: eukaryotic translation initiation factor 5-like [Branchiostoma belcheri]
MALNVNREVQDQFYRYKMPRIIAKVEGKGNGIKTVIPNMTDVAKALSRPATYTTKFFGCELGAQTQLDVKNDRYIVNGAHDATKLQDLLDIFIKKFVLCQECDNPETNLKVFVKKGVIAQHCIACGYTGMLDMTHKLTTYILKYPPDQTKAKDTPSKTDSKRKRDKKGKQQQENGTDGGSPTSHSPPPDQEDDDWGDDGDWSVDTSAEAVAARMEQLLTDGAKAITLNDDLVKTVEERLNQFFEFVKAKRDAGQIEGNDKEIFAEAERLDVHEKGILVLCELLLDDKMVTQLKKYQKIFLRFCYESPKTQKNLLGGFEQLVNLHKEALLPKVPVLLKTMYDLDLVDEEVILQWGDKVSKKYVSKELSQQIHDKAAPVITWLKEAEEETSEDEDEVEVVYDNKATELKTEKVPTNNQEEEDDLDIDAI